MTISIVESFSKSSLLEGLNGSHNYFIESDNIQLSFSPNSFVLTDLKHSLDSGFICPRVKIINYSETRILEITEIFSIFAYCSGDVYKSFVQLSAENDFKPKTIDNFDVYFDPANAYKVFSPFALRKVKPLGAIPLVWSLGDVLRVLANNQFSDCRCASAHTNDCSVQALALMHDLVTEPTGWRAAVDNGRVKLWHHHIKCGSFIPVV